MYRGILNQLALLILLSSVVCTRPVSPPMMRFSAGSHSHSACSSSFGNVILAHACMVFEQEHCSGPTRMQGHEKQANKKPSSYTWSERAGPARRYRARRGLSKQKMADWWQSKYERQRLMRIFILRGRGVIAVILEEPGQNSIDLSWTQNCPPGVVSKEVLASMSSQ